MYFLAIDTTRRSSTGTLPPSPWPAAEQSAGDGTSAKVMSTRRPLLHIGVGGTVVLLELVRQFSSSSSVRTICAAMLRSLRLGRNRRIRPNSWDRPDRILGATPLWVPP